MTDPDGGFYSAEDADSLPNTGGRRKARARSTSGRRRRSTEALGEDAEVFDRFYGVEADGNAPAGSDPQANSAAKIFSIQRLMPRRPSISARASSSR